MTPLTGHRTLSDAAAWARIDDPDWTLEDVAGAPTACEHQGEAPVPCSWKSGHANGIQAAAA